MNIKSKLIFTALIFASLFVTKSCNESDDQLNVNKNNSELSYFGIYKKSYNEIVDLSAIANLDIDLITGKTIANEVFYYNDGSKGYVFNKENNNYLVKVNSKNQLISNTSFTVLDYVDNSNYQFKIIDENGITNEYSIK